MTGNRIAAVLVAGTLLLAGLGFAEPDASLLYARRGGDDAVEGGASERPSPGRIGNNAGDGR